jgi:hypothetical protein
MGVPEETDMASRRTTFDKLQRERAKKAKAAAKRERRLDKSSNPTGEEGLPAVGSTDDPATLLDDIAALHARFEANEIDFEEFEELKTDLYERLAALPAE